MLPITIDDIFDFVALQCQLTTEFLKQYPTSKDFIYLLDFPKNGIINVDGEPWKFFRHGIGVQFSRKRSGSRAIVNIHQYFGQPKVIDVWRLLEFFDPRMKDATKNRIILLLDEMCSKGYLIDQKNETYLLDSVVTKHVLF
jgi:hypothetical protein